MVLIKPFAALRPVPALAPKVCELPYDVMSTAEARQTAAGNPLSFLHVSKPEIDLPADTDPVSPAVYARGRENFARLIAEGVLQPEPAPAFYLYRQVMGDHAQLGLVAAASCAAYLRGDIRKHELTRPDKEDDRVRHIEALNAQTGPAFLVYRAAPALDAFLATLATAAPDTDFTAPDGVRHTAWAVREAAAIRRIEAEFATIARLFIADGHHRSAAAARVFQTRHGGGESPFFLAVIFPHNQMQILPYHRVLKDLNGLSSAQLLERLRQVFTIEPAGAAAPARRGELGFYLAGGWQRLVFRPEALAGATGAEALDVALLQRRVLEPVFGIANPRTDKRLDFVGGIRGPGELERLVNGGAAACAFALFPTSIEDLMEIADQGGIMPPKSTWFEPKLRDAMFCHLL
jgi:uncharacterized protein (DUF1015 family)